MCWRGEAGGAGRWALVSTLDKVWKSGKRMVFVQGAVKLPVGGHCGRHKTVRK